MVSFANDWSLWLYHFHYHACWSDLVSLLAARNFCPLNVHYDSPAPLSQWIFFYFLLLRSHVNLVIWTRSSYRSFFSLYCTMYLLIVLCFWKMKFYYTQYLRAEDSLRNSIIIILTYSFSSQLLPSTKLLHQIHKGLTVHIASHWPDGFSQRSYKVPWCLHL